MSSKAASVGTSNGWSEFGISVLNGVVGDYLVRRGNGLAIPMAFVQDGRPLTLNAQALRTAQPACTGKLVVLIHGWCCNEDVWRFANDGTTYATKLQHDAGYTPFAVRYNSGMPIAKSGAAFDEQMTALVAAYPCAIDEIVLIGHSMGGLVIRSACEHGAHRAAAWLPLIRHAFYIGTPHDGADLERFAQGTTAALASTPNPVARLFGRLLDIRSIGSGTCTTAVRQRSRQVRPHWLGYRGSRRPGIIGWSGRSPTIHNIRSARHSATDWCACPHLRLARCPAQRRRT